MKKISIALALSALLSTSAFAYVAPLETIEQASKFCPAVDQLSFIQLDTRDQNGFGYVSASKGSVNFTSFFYDPNDPTGPIEHPKLVDANGKIENVSFRISNHFYGFIMGHASERIVTCYYAYPGYDDTTVNFVLRSTK